jgi:hypothetical protein
MIKLRRMRWACLVARRRKRRCAYKGLVGKAEGNRQLEDLGVERRIILKLIFNKWDGSMDWIYLAQESDPRVP